MKKCLITVVCGCFALFAFSQNGYNPPRNVRESFQKEYPNSQASQWNHSSNGWSVNFEDRDHQYGEVTAHFDRNGRHMDTHIPYDNNDVPPPVRDNLRTRYPGSDRYEYTRIDRSGENSVYQVRLRHRKRSRIVYVDDQGRQRDFNDRHY